MKNASIAVDVAKSYDVASLLRPAVVEDCFRYNVFVFNKQHCLPYAEIEDGMSLKNLRIAEMIHLLYPVFDKACLSDDEAFRFLEKYASNEDIVTSCRPRDLYRVFENAIAEAIDAHEGIVSILNDAYWDYIDYMINEAKEC